MLRHRVLFYDSSRENRKTAIRVLCATGEDCSFPQDLEELEDLVENNKYSLMIMDIVAHKHLTSKNFDLEKENIVILSSEKLKDVNEYLIDIPTFNNFIAKNDEGTFTTRELLSTTRKILNNDIFGVEKYLGWGAANTIFHIRDSSRRREYIDIAMDYCRSMKLRQPIIEAVQSISEEFLMNALYDAPRDEEGNELFKALSRTERVLLSPENSARFEIASDGNHLAISVSDPFGGLRRSIVIEYLTRCFRSHNNKLGPQSKAGAGLGLYLCFNSVSSFIVNIDPHIRTEFIGILDLNLSVKDFKRQNKSFHFFCKDSSAKQFRK